MPMAGTSSPLAGIARFNIPLLPAACANDARDIAPRSVAAAIASGADCRNFRRVVMLRSPVTDACLRAARAAMCNPIPREVKRMPELDIGDVARRAGLPVSTLRYYEEKGLIASVGRNGLRRQ